MLPLIPSRFCNFGSYFVVTPFGYSPNPLTIKEVSKDKVKKWHNHFQVKP
jgi:hypothetical protein